MRKFFSFRSVPFQYICSFRFGFSHKPKSNRPDGRLLFFFSHPRPNVSRLRRPGAARAQPWIQISAVVENELFNLDSFFQRVATVNVKPTNSLKFASLSRKSFVTSK